VGMRQRAQLVSAWAGLDGCAHVGHDGSLNESRVQRGAGAPLRSFD
jgi:hypothetical protein